MKRSLFQNVARNRPEWLIQGVLAHALEVEPDLRRFLLRKAGLGYKTRQIDTAPRIRSEQKVGRWRADLVMSWPEELELRLELKLCAGLTDAQRRTLKRHHALVIHPHGNRPDGLSDHPCVSWADISKPNLVRDAAVRRLLREANTSSTWQLETLTGAAMRKDFGEFVRKRSARGDWERIWAFLATVDERLLQLVPGDYRPGSWAMSRKEDPPYYGWWFKLRGQRQDWFWFGFEGPADTAKFELTHHTTLTEWSRLQLKLSAPYDASLAAERILEAAGAHLRQAKGAKPSRRARAA